MKRPFVIWIVLFPFLATADLPAAIAADNDKIEGITASAEVTASFEKKNGTTEYHPEGMVVTVNGVFNGNKTSVKVKTTYIKTVEDVAFFRTGDGVPLSIWVSSGLVVPCFASESIPAISGGGPTADALLKAWLGKEFGDTSTRIGSAVPDANAGSPIAMKYLSLTVHPDAQRALAKLQGASDPKVARAATAALETSNTLKSMLFK
jgi:hypothetical protein